MRSFQMLTYAKTARAMLGSVLYDGAAHSEAMREGAG